MADSQIPFYSLFTQYRHCLMSITSWNNSHNDDDDNNDNDDDDDDNNKIRQYSEFTLITVNIIVR